MITSTFTSKAGAVTLEIDDGGSATTTEITSMGKIKYSYDITPSSPKVETVKAFYAKCTIEFFQYSPTQEDLYGRLRTAILSEENHKIKATVTIAGNAFIFFVSLQDITVVEKTRLMSVELRPLIDRAVGVMSVFDSIPIGAFVTFRHNEDVAEELDACGVADWIDQAMKDIFLNNYDSIVLSNPTGLGAGYDTNNYTSFNGRTLSSEVLLTMVKMPSSIFKKLEEVSADEKFSRGSVFSNGTGTLTGGDFGGLSVGWSIRLINTAGQSIFFIIDSIVSDAEIVVSSPSAPVVPVAGFYAINLHAKLATTDAYTALDALQGLAGIEGAIFGQGFGKNFYLNRIQEQDVVSINFENEVVDMGSEIFYNPLGGGFVEQVATTIKDLDSGDLNEGTKTFGIFPVDSGTWRIPRIVSTRSSIDEIIGNDSRLNLRLAPAYPFLSKAKAISASMIVGNYTDWDFDFDPIFSLCRAGLLSYQRSLASDGTKDTIEFTIFGMSKVKPWNLIEFTNIPALYSKYADRKFRPTSIDYDPVQDLATIKAYEIG